MTRPRLPGPLVDAEWLRDGLADPDAELAIADTRWYPDRPRRQGYLDAHIPGAVFLDLDTDLAAPVRPDRRGGRHPLPDPADFAAAMSRAGIADDTPVVAYDDSRGSIAARLWWMLHVLGHPVALLDGGLQAWQAIGGPTETGEAPAPPQARFTAREWPPEAAVDALDVDRLRTDPGAVIVDARVAARYRGETEPLDPVAGHIPGARNVPWTEVIDPSTGRFLPPDRLRDRYAAAGVREGGSAVAQCGSGVMACHTLLAFELAGIEGGRLYVGSWSDWVSDPAHPVATGPDP